MPRAMTPLAVVRGLQQAYAPFKTALSYDQDWQLLIAVVLSAQTTDAQVNKATAGLFKAYPALEHLARAPLASIEKLIFSTGFYKTKAKNIRAAAQTIVSNFQGVVPASMEQLITIPGVGRKTANVFLHVVHEKAQGIVVDTHIFRVSNRTGASSAKTPQLVERELMQTLPKNYWILYSDLAIQHGREICHARKPECGRCPLRITCPSAIPL